MNMTLFIKWSTTLNLSIFGAEKMGWENKLLFVLIALTEYGSKHIDGQFRSMRYKVNTLVRIFFKSIQDC